MRVLSIDPGYDRVGIAVIDRANGKEALAYSDCLSSPKGAAIPERLAVVGSAIEQVCDEWRPDALALETLFFNTNQKTAMAVAQMRGVAAYIATNRGMRIFEYTPSQIKVAVTGYGKSDKQQVTEMVARLVALPKRKRFDDEYDAIAVGLTCLASERI